MGWCHQGCRVPLIQISNQSKCIFHNQVFDYISTALDTLCLFPSNCWYWNAPVLLKIPVDYGDRGNVWFVRHFWTGGSHRSHPSLKCIDLCQRGKIFRRNGEMQFERQALNCLHISCRCMKMHEWHIRKGFMDGWHFAKLNQLGRMNTNILLWFCF